jgi:alkanesulfonate monooxygenase SsuD/methylene tetrahydromethanopterin reductase-like flavin-dependent oxidoreductase (luciferase family)
VLINRREVQSGRAGDTRPISALRQHAPASDYWRDHFQPWQANEGHCGEAWVTLGALGGRAEPAWIGTTVTCPILRYHPAVVAEAFASLAQLYPGRVFLGVGSGEALNEQAATGYLTLGTRFGGRLPTQAVRKLPCSICS